MATGMDNKTIQSSGEWFIWRVKLKESSGHNEDDATELDVLARTVDEAIELALFMEAHDGLGDGNLFVYSVELVADFWFWSSALDELRAGKRYA